VFLGSPRDRSGLARSQMKMSATRWWPGSEPRACRSGSPPPGTACAGSSAARPGCAGGSGPGQRPAAGHPEHPDGPGWPAGRPAQGWCEGCVERATPAGWRDCCRPYRRSGAPVACGAAQDTRPPHPHLIHQPDQPQGVGVLARSEAGDQVAAPAVADGMELGVSPPVTVPAPAGGLPGSAGAPVTGAGGVLVGADDAGVNLGVPVQLPAPSAWVPKVASMRAQVPSVCQRANRLSTVSHGPDRSGRSRQGIPARVRNTMPLRTGR
jgi:hypothetical protein